MSGPVAVSSFLARWNGTARFDLAGSDSETLPLAELLALADEEDIARWQRLEFGYASPLGAPWLRAAIARRHSTLDLEDVICCAGAQEGMFCAAQAILTSDDHAIVVLPMYRPCVEAVTSICPVTGVRLDGSDWQLDLDEIAAAIRPNTRLVLTNFPNSPTGAVLDGARLVELIDLCRRHGLWLVNDEIYRQTDLEAEINERPAVVDAYERGISINGLSKGFGLPGLRVGWMACRDRTLRERILWAKSKLSTCVSSMSEVLAHVALGAEATIVSRTRSIGNANWRHLRRILDECDGLAAGHPPRNAAFGFLRTLGPERSDEFATRLVLETGVLVMPSTFWASSLADIPDDHVRINLGHVRSASGLDRIGMFVARQVVRA